MNLLTLTGIAGPQAAQVTTPVKLSRPPRNITLQATFTYDSGGTTVDGWVQTTLDGGKTWTDIANFHFTTSSLRKIINLNAQTPVTTQVTPTDGSMTANTAQDGIVGPQFRVKYSSTGTYGGASSLSIDAATDDNNT